MTVGSYVQDLNGRWHASVEFDGYEHITACQMTLRAPDQLDGATLPSDPPERSTWCEACEDSKGGDRR